MNRTKKLTAALLLFSLLLTLAGCGFASRMATAAKKMEKLRSYRMDLALDMEMSLSMMGESMEMDMSMTGVTDVNTEPYRTKTDMRIGMLGESVQVLGYTEKTDAAVVSYSSVNGGESWIKTAIPTGAEKAPDKQSFSALLALASSFAESGKESVRGSDATVYSGVITGENLESVMAMSDMLQDVLSAMDMSMEGLDLKDCGSIPVTIAIDDKTNLVVRYTMDLTEFMGKLMPIMVDAVMSEAAEKSGLEGMDMSALGFGMETGRVFASVELYDFDAVGPIEIPEAALVAPEAA